MIALMRVMMQVLCKIRWMVLTATLCLAICSAISGTWRHDPVPGTSLSSSSANPQFAIADLDGDRSPDFATIELQRTDSQRNFYSIRVRLTSGSQKSFGVTAPSGGLQIVPRDVNGDSVPDLLVSAFRRPIAVLINDGHGNFTSASPAAFPELVWETPVQWGARSDKDRERSVLILPRTPVGESRQRTEPSRPLRSVRLLSSRPCAAVSLQCFPPYLSRPPPFFALHS
jgi:hypothetical protein